MTLEGRPTAQTRAIAEIMTDPLNRFYRYPVARFILPLFLATSITPNQVTCFHTGIGILAAVCVAQGSFRGLVIGFALSELRLVLDCLDGVLARAKKMSSPYGRTIDALGDAVSYLALCIAIFVHVRREQPEFPIATSTLAMMGLGGLMAWVHDFYHRRFAAALKSGTDTVYEELFAKHAKLRQGDAGFLGRFGFAFDWMQVLVLQPALRREIDARLEAGTREPPDVSLAEVQWILKSAHSKASVRAMRPALRAISLVSADNVIGILNVGLLTGSMAFSQLFVVGYGIFMMAATILLCNVFLHASRRAMASEEN